MSQARGKSASPHSRDFVRHDPRIRVQAVSIVCPYRDAEQRRVRRVAAERADRDGIRIDEVVILDDDGRARFPRVISTSGNSPDLSSFQELISETASINL
jgi:hypothetical protein